MPFVPYLSTGCLKMRMLDLLEVASIHICPCLIVPRAAVLLCFAQGIETDLVDIRSLPCYSSSAAIPLWPDAGYMRFRVMFLHPNTYPCAWNSRKGLPLYGVAEETSTATNDSTPKRNDTPDKTKPTSKPIYRSDLACPSVVDFLSLTSTTGVNRETIPPPPTSAHILIPSLTLRTPRTHHSKHD